MPDGRWKQFIRNSIDEVEWPDVRLSPVKTRFPDGRLEAVLVPHLHEFDFEAHLYRQLTYESEVFLWLSTRFYRTVIELGANVGIFSIFFSRRFSEAVVYAFEPSRTVFARLLANLALNQCPNLFVFNCAIYAESGFLDFHEPEGHLANGSLDPSFASIFSRQVVSAPVAVLAASGMERFFKRSPVLVKIDVEGAEPQVLKALDSLIERYRPDLLIEVLPVTVAALNKLAFVRDGSYRLFNIRPEGLIAQPEFVATEWRDYALLPASPAAEN
jgi:FkbM family methyltransferase